MKNLLLLLFLASSCTSPAGEPNEGADDGWALNNNASDAAANNNIGVDGGAQNIGTADGGASNIGTADGGAASGFAACNLTADCSLAIAACCWPCGETALSDFDAINSTQAEAHQMDVCPIPEPCPRCASFPNPNLLATCNAGTCEGIDIGDASWSECTTDTDCALRTNTCCECTDVRPDTVIAMRTDALQRFSDAMCDPGTACDLCLPSFDGYAARCVESRCTIEGR